MLNRIEKGKKKKRITCSSEYKLNGSKFSRRVPENKTGSCGIIVRFDLKSSRPRTEILTPSILISPLTDSTILNKARVNEDFPAPVRPTTPIFSVEFTTQLICLRTKSSPFR